MANHTYHYFGAYLEIEVQRVSRKYAVRECENGHTAGGPFCNQCGAPVSDRLIMRLEYPTGIVDDLLPIEYVDILTEITPPQIYGTGIILARDNGYVPDDTDTWLYLSPWHGNDDPFVLKFPSTEEINAMIDAFTNRHGEIVMLLKNHPAVLSVEIKAGYVYCPEY